MIDLTMQDETQKAILSYLVNTETLIRKAIEKETHKPAACQIVGMPDLGIATNKGRMQGGFFTGMYASWKSDISFVPVDATVNVCGVHVARLQRPISSKEFKEIVTKGQHSKDLGYTWNFDSGNHFIMLANGQGGSQHIVLHASAAEYKKENPDLALYPTENCWYADKIKTYSHNGKSLRYITGETAEKFIDMAIALEKFNDKRNKDVTQKLFGDFEPQDILTSSHYGMPSRNSVAVGCSWKPGKSVMLTAPGKEIFIVDILKGNQNTIDGFVLSPHGFGVEAANGKFDFENYYDLKVRGQDLNNSEIKTYVQKILQKCPAKIIEKLSPICSYNRGKFWDKETIKKKTTIVQIPVRSGTLTGPLSLQSQYNIDKTSAKTTKGGV